jgi:hypothetical protein
VPHLSSFQYCYYQLDKREKAGNFNTKQGTLEHLALDRKALSNKKLVMSHGGRLMSIYKVPWVWPESKKLRSIL